MSNPSSVQASPWRSFGAGNGKHQLFDVAVILVTHGTASALETVQSVFSQRDCGRIQLLIGIDALQGDLDALNELLASAPTHISTSLLNPGYSTSSRHGGLHPAADGGAMRTALSYLAHARYLAYIEDDVTWEANHLCTLLASIHGHDWAFSLRTFVHPRTRFPVGLDQHESTGPGRGEYAVRFGGWVDPNCLLIDKVACEPALRWWSIPVPQDPSATSAGRHVYDWLQKHGKPGETGISTVYCPMQQNDGNHTFRLSYLATQYEQAAQKPIKQRPLLTSITVCKNRLEHLKQSLPLLAKNADLEIIVVDYGCSQGTSAWVKENYPQVKVVEITDGSTYVTARGRNIGEKYATTHWLLFIDADVLIQEPLLDWAKNNLKTNNFYITQKQGSELTGTFFCNRYDFDRIDGFDECFDLWGGEDDDVYFRLQKSGVHPQCYPETMFSSISHDNSVRMAEYNNLSRITAQAICNAYRCVKYDVMDLKQRKLTLDERKQIRRSVREFVESDSVGGNRFIYSYAIGERVDVFHRFQDFALQCTLTYKNVLREV